MKKCPACHHEVDLFAAECEFCGVIFAKWEARHSEESASSDTPASSPEAPPDANPPSPVVPPDGLEPLPPAAEQILEETTKAASGKGLYFLLGFVALITLVGLFWVFQPDPDAMGASGGMSSPSGGYGGVCPSLGRGDEFGRVVRLRGEPQGLAWGGGEFLSGNRIKPWGFLRLSCNGRMDRVQVKDPVQGQVINFWCLTFNGREYVTYTDGRWVQSPAPEAFIVHEARDLGIVGHFPAPPRIGGLAWDGTAYWAATRKNSFDEAGESWLYKMDERFNVVQKWPAPLSGCQGLSWANGILFWADFFAGEIVLFRVEGDRLVRLHGYRDAEKDLSGIVFDGENLWMSEIRTRRLRMLPARLTRAWFMGDYRVADFSACVAARVLLAYDAGDEKALGEILSLASRTEPDAQKLRTLCDALDSLGVRDPMMNAMEAILADPVQVRWHPLVLGERARWVGALPAAAVPPEAVEEPSPTATATLVASVSPTAAVSTPATPIGGATPSITATGIPAVP